MPCAALTYSAGYEYLFLAVKPSRLRALPLHNGALLVSSGAATRYRRSCCPVSLRKAACSGVSTGALEVTGTTTLATGWSGRPGGGVTQAASNATGISVSVSCSRSRYSCSVANIQYSPKNSYRGGAERNTCLRSYCEAIRQWQSERAQFHNFWNVL